MRIVLCRADCRLTNLEFDLHTLLGDSRKVNIEHLSILQCLLCSHRSEKTSRLVWSAHIMLYIQKKNCMHIQRGDKLTSEILQKYLGKQFDLLRYTQAKLLTQ